MSIFLCFLTDDALTPDSSICKNMSGLGVAITTVVLGYYMSLTVSVGFHNTHSATFLYPHVKKL